MIRSLRKSFFLLLPLWVIGGLWMVAEDREQAARHEERLRFLPGFPVKLERPEAQLDRPNTLVDASAELLKSLIPA